MGAAQCGACSALAVALLGLSAAPVGAELAPFGALTGAANPLNGQDVGNYSAPSFADLDSDGDLDLVAGNLTGTFFYFENTGSATSLAFLARTGAANPLDGHDVGSYSSPSLGDLDADGDFDLVAGESDGVFNYFENTGSASTPAFVARTGTANPLDGQDVGANSIPSLGDLDGDGDLDLVAGENSGVFFYFENTGSATSPAFIERTGAANPLDGQSLGNSDAAPSLSDLDGDGDLDLVAGEYFGGFAYFENTGGATSPGFIQRTGVANPLNGQDVGTDSTPALGDLDGDGDLDVVAGEGFTGTFFYFENTGSATSPAFVLRAGAMNPLDGQDVGFTSRPSLGDLDGDGDLDLVTGNVDGAFAVHYFPEPARALLLGAGIALLGLLARLRRR